MYIYISVSGSLTKLELLWWVYLHSRASLGVEKKRCVTEIWCASAIGERKEGRERERESLDSRTAAASFESLPAEGC